MSETLIRNSIVTASSMMIGRPDAVQKFLLVKTPRNIYEEASDVARALARTKAFKQPRREGSS